MESVPPKQRKDGRRSQERQPVGGGGHSLSRVSGDVLRHETGGEGQEGDEHKDEQVEPQEGYVHSVEIVGNCVVTQPKGADGGKADHVAQVRRPLLADGVEQVPLRLRAGRDSQVEGQKGDGDGKDTVTKSLQPSFSSCPPLTARRTCRLVGLAHRLISALPPPGTRDHPPG